MKNKNLIKILLIILAIVAAGVIYTLVSSSGNNADDVQISDESEAGTESEENTSEEAPGYIIDQTAVISICVHVCGAVNTPGVYYLPEGSRIHQAIEQAGGFTPDADESVVNLASFVSDGMQIYIPDKDEAEAEGLRPAAEAEADDGLININTADAEQLMKLPGIGQAKADQIIAYRNENGSFLTTEDIQNVSGIGESSFNKFKDLIKV